MMESLKAVSELKTENTPRQIIDTVQTFQHNASIYLKYAESHPEENQNIVTEAALGAVSQGNEDIYRACLTDVKMNKNIHQQKAETEQQLEAQMLTHPNENGFRRYRLFPPSAHEHKLAAADKLL